MRQVVGVEEEHVVGLDIYDLFNVLDSPFSFEVDDDGHRLVLLVEIVGVAGVPAGADVRREAGFADRI